MQSHLSPKDRIALSAVLWTVAVGGMALGIVFPLYVRLQNFPSSFGDISYRFQETNSNIEAFAKMKAEFTDIASNIVVIRSQFLDPKGAKNEIAFIESLEELARTLELHKDLQLTSVPDVSGNDRAKSFYAFTLTLVGSFEHLMTFIAHLENFPYLVDIERASFRPVKEGQTYTTTESDSAKYSASAGDIAVSMTIQVHATP